MKYQKRLIETKRINRQFSSNPRNVYRTMKGDSIKITRVPTKEELHSYWENIWGNDINYNEKAPWLNDLESNYCSEIQQKNCDISKEMLDQAISKTQNGKAAGPDGIIGYWYKQLHFYRPNMLALFKKSLDGKYDIPEEIVTAKTVLIPKNDFTNLPKNYRPIACLNIMYKLQTSCLNSLMQEH